MQPENRDNWQIYEFIDKACQGGTRNEVASTSGVQQLVLVLDGQQRLTSLLIGLKGSYSITLWAFDEFPAFLEAREKLIADRLKEVLGDPIKPALV